MDSSSSKLGRTGKMLRYLYPQPSPALGALLQSCLLALFASRGQFLLFNVCMCHFKTYVKYFNNKVRMKLICFNHMLSKSTLYNSLNMGVLAYNLRFKVNFSELLFTDTKHWRSGIIGSINTDINYNNICIKF